MKGKIDNGQRAPLGSSISLELKKGRELKTPRARYLHSETAAQNVGHHARRETA